MSEAPTAPWRESAGLFLSEGLAAAGLPHGVTHRRLGSMKEPAARARVLEAAGLGGRPLFVGKQAHGTTILRAGHSESGMEGDGWLVLERGPVAGIFAADCMPIFIWDEKLSAVGVFHAGWKGAAAGMAEAGARALVDAGVPAARLRAAVGPHARACCYRVGPELRAKFRPESFRERGGELFLDLGEEARARLVSAGIAPERVEISSDCTVCGADKLFSFRRERMDHRMLAFIGLP
ncbi:MAG TPA: polyphenol oxidase family protein [Elusimicrobiota bacterium]|nr:polyphenol oxidase family protein [Elusimicrobiota bacterium]